jgi:hypothetical protein
MDLNTCVGNFGKNIWTYFGLGTPPIGAKTVTNLPNGTSITITFTWNTTGCAKGNYTIWAYAWRVLGETDTTDNTCTDSIIYVGFPGDVNGDGKVELKDVYRVSCAYGSLCGDDGLYWHTPPCNRGSPCPHSPNCDINNDEKIDLKDYYATIKNFGQPKP